MRAFDINVENRAKEIARDIAKQVLKETTDRDEIKALAKEVAKEAIFDIVNSKKDRRFQNTKLLMRNYNTLKEHINNEGEHIEIKYEFEKEAYIKLEYMWLESIARSKARTIEMINYVDLKLKYLKYKYEEKCECDKYRAFEMYYIEGKTNEEIQEEFYISKNTPGRWINEITRELSILLWGIDAINLYN